MRGNSAVKIQGFLDVLSAPQKKNYKTNHQEVLKFKVRILF